jgi:hypothetical protein
MAQKVAGRFRCVGSKDCSVGDQWIVNEVARQPEAKDLLLLYGDL